jgi:23S rRNA pseudouridine2604 synthase
MEPKRLNKFISDSGFCSRREADKLIEEERVTVNGKLPKPGMQVTPKDKVRIDDQILRVREEVPVFLVFNKPAGMSAKSDASVRDNVVRAINYPATLEPVGYLERDSEGLLFLTNDTELGRRITRSDNRFEKEYVVTVDKMITTDFISKMMGGGETEKGEKIPRTYIEKLGSSRFKIILVPGSNHNLKMLCENHGYRVTHLQRIRIQNFSLAKLPLGHWRALTPAEVDSLRETAATRNASPVYSRNQSGDSYGANKPTRREGSRQDGSAFKSAPKQGGSAPREGKSRPKSDKSNTPKGRNTSNSSRNAKAGAKNSALNKGSSTQQTGRRGSAQRGNK